MDKLEEIVKDTRTTLECLMNPGMRADKEDLVEIRKGFEAVVAEVERLQKAKERRNQLYHHWRVRAEVAEALLKKAGDDLEEAATLICLHGCKGINPELREANGCGGCPQVLDLRATLAEIQEVS